MNNDFQTKCSELTDERLKELFNQVCQAMLNKEHSRTTTTNVPMGDLIGLMFRRAITSWESIGGTVSLTIMQEAWGEPVTYKTGVNNDL